MAYNQNIPQATDTIASSQDPILQNFQAIKQLIDVNHGTFGGTGVNQEGKHKFVEMPNQSADPAAATGEMTIYSKTYTGQTNQSEAFVLRNNLAGPNVPIPFTAGAQTGTEPEKTGWYFLPCGFIVKFGVASISAGNNAPVPVTMAQGPAMTTIYNIQLTAYVGGSAANPQDIHYYVSTANGNTFNIKSNSAVAYRVFYTVLGAATP